MDRRQIGTKLALDALGVDVRQLDAFDERLIIQKAIYLAQTGGIGRGYFFRWYLRGPYCSELARDVFGIASELGAGFDESDGWTLDSASSQRLSDLKPLLDPREPMARARWLELLASVHFLVSGGETGLDNPAAIRERLTRYGKDFAEREILTALEALQEYELIRGRC